MAGHHRVLPAAAGRHGHLPRSQAADRGPPGPGRRSPHPRDAGGPTKRSKRPWGPAARLQLQWRPKVAEAQVDRGLTVEPSGLLDVKEDGLRLAWNSRSNSAAASATASRSTLPAEYLVEKVAGSNVRGWEVRSDGRPARRSKSAC